MNIKKRYILLFGILFMTVFTLGYIKYYNLNFNEITFKVLGWVKILKGEAVDLDELSAMNTPTMEHHNWTELLKRNVTDSGQVNYKGFIQDRILLQGYLDDLSEYSPGNNWTKNEQLAYWINTYNAFTVKLIIDNYPLKSIKYIGDGLPMIGSSWDIKFFKIGNVDFDLNTIEHDILRRKFSDPRIHFAINCASFSCPKLRNEAYIATKLEAQLEAQAVDFMNTPDKNVITDTETKISKVFDWFQSDFIKNSTLLEFIKRYNPSLNEANKVEYMDYNWAINEG